MKFRLICFLSILFLLLMYADLHSQVKDSLLQKNASGSTEWAASKLIPFLDSLPEDADIFGAYLIPKICKGYDLLYLQLPPAPVPAEQVVVERRDASGLPVAKVHKPLLKVSGNVFYDVYYRSRIDTPYAERDIYQHTVQARLDILYKDQYPMRVYLTTRFSNSSLFRKYTDLNLQFNSADFKRILKAKISKAVESFVESGYGELDSLKHIIDRKRLLLASLSQAVQKPDLSQQQVEEREKILFTKPGGFQIPDASSALKLLREQGNWANNFKFNKRFSDSTYTALTDDLKDQPGNNTGVKKIIDSIEYKKSKIDSLSAELYAAEKLYRKLQSLRQYNLSELKNQIEGAKDVTVLVQKLKQLNIPDSILPKGYKTLSSIQSVSIGRSTADYSELSVKNINITGVQAEYNPRYYYAIAVGKVDYRFRDYLVSGRARSRQYVALARFGKGTKDGNHVFFTYYTGRRQFFNASLASQSSGRIPEYNLAGITIEGFYKVSRNISLVAEIAKSSKPYYSLDSLQRKGWMNSVTNFNDRSNEAYAARVQSYFPKSQTRFSGSVRYTGANFQSFSTFTTGASQLRWKSRLEQPFFKKQLTIISSLEQNDYNNPFVSTAYKSSSVLASLQANLRFKKWPVISMGYYPSFQLVKTGDDQYTESRYYTLSASAGYYYKVKSVQVSSYLLYSQFFNEANDSGFVYYNSRNLLFSQNIFFRKVSMMVSASLNRSIDYTVKTIESSGEFRISKVVAAGAGVKMIKHDLLSAMQWGYSGSLSLNIPKLGEIQLMMDKGFIPGMNLQLVDNRMGRLTYYKTF